MEGHSPLMLIIAAMIGDYGGFQLRRNFGFRSQLWHVVRDGCPDGHWCYDGSSLVSLTMLQHMFAWLISLILRMRGGGVIQMFPAGTTTTVRRLLDNPWSGHLHCLVSVMSLLSRIQQSQHSAEIASLVLIQTKVY